MNTETEKEQPVVTSSTPDDNAAPAEKPDPATEEVEEQEEPEEQEETEESAPSDGDDAPAPRQNKGVGKRINELTREKYEALREAEQLRRELEAVRNPQQPPAQAADRPTLEQFDFDQERYLEALTDYRITQKENEAKQAQAREAAQQQAVTFKERESAFVAEHPDYYDVAYTAPINYSEAMLEAIRESDVAPAIAYHLAQNLDTAAEISRMSPFGAAKAIGRIEAQLSAPASPSQPRTVPKAPAPVATLRPAATIKKDLESLSMEDYAAERNRQRKAQGLIR